MEPAALEAGNILPAVIRFPKGQQKSAYLIRQALPPQNIDMSAAIATQGTEKMHAVPRCSHTAITPPATFLRPQSL